MSMSLTVLTVKNKQLRRSVISDVWLFISIHFSMRRLCNWEGNYLEEILKKK